MAICILKEPRRGWGSVKLDCRTAASRGAIGVWAVTALLAIVFPAFSMAAEEQEMSRFVSWIADHQGVSRVGESELWMDPAGNNAEISDSTMRVVPGGIAYTWMHEGAQQRGELRWDGEALLWRDSWHQAEGVVMAETSGHGSLVAAEYSYAAGAGPDWHWRIKLAERPDGTLVLQMTNIAPWGEEARAVRAVFRPVE
jgi:hypothetical protein